MPSTPVISLYGRLGQPPQARTSANGKSWTTASRAVAIPSREGDVTEWFSLVAFGTVAEALGQSPQGAMLGLIGRLQLAPPPREPEFDDALPF